MIIKLKRKRRGHRNHHGGDEILHEADFPFRKTDVKARSRKKKSSRKGGRSETQEREGRGAARIFFDIVNPNFLCHLFFGPSVHYEVITGLWVQFSLKRLTKKISPKRSLVRD